MVQTICVAFCLLVGLCVSFVAPGIRRYSTRIPFVTDKSIHELYSSVSSVTSTSSEKRPCDWSFIDKVCIITTTKSDPLRLERTTKELKKIGLIEKAKIYTFKPDDEDRIRGCYTSHISVLKDASKSLKSKDGKILILEDNLEITDGFNPSTVNEIKEFLSQIKSWDIFQLGYMAYVPNLQMNKLPFQRGNIVLLKSDENAALGTSAYIISKSGANKILSYDSKNGYNKPIPNIISLLFKDERYAAYPMLFHRAPSVKSLVNPKLDDFRKLMFNPLVRSSWEKLLYTTGLTTNTLFQGVCLLLALFVGSAGYTLFLSLSSSTN
mmetsp:Transcript_10226/g.10297  ORF Transcript_10226/g.10297 Transcript_10226/m.10297 type:complete len:323 (-) Transcript_10226:51-1019(-)